MTSIQPSSAAGMQPSAPQAPARAVESGQGAPANSAAVSPPPATPAATKTSKPAERPPEPLIDLAKMRRELEAAIERLNDQVSQNARELGFSIDEETDRLIVRVTNKETGELVRQIPAEAVIRFANSWEDLRGVLFDAEL